MTIREVLNKIFWDKREKPADYEVTFIHRGAYMDRKTIPCSLITNVENSWFTYKMGEEEFLIPFHRITEIKNVRKGKIVWSREIDKTAIR